MNFIQTEFNNFFRQSYTTPMSEKQKREIQMNFYRGAFIFLNSAHATRDMSLEELAQWTKDVKHECKTWIQNYIIDRTNEKGGTPP